MIRFFLALILLMSPVAIIARPAGPPDVAMMQQRLEEADRRAEAAETATQIREAADRLEDAQTQQAYNRFEIWTGLLVGFFSVLFTILIVIFGFRTVKVAAIEASAAAQREVTDRIGAIDALSEKAKEATARAEASAQEADDEVRKVREGARAFSQAAERMRVEVAEPTSAQVNLTEDEAAAVKAGAEASPEKPTAELSIDEFRLQIAKAAYIDHDYSSALRLATLMEAYHSADDRALGFALRHQGDALNKLGRINRALGVYSDLAERFSATKDPDIEFDVVWARHHQGLILSDLGRHVEAEDLFRTLVPIAERLFGPESSNALTARHELGRTFLEQGRAREAEPMFRALVPIWERTLGAEHSYTLITRHELARALLEQEKAQEAVDELRTLLPIVERVDGANVAATYVTRSVFADALLRTGKAEEAEGVISLVPDAPADPEWMPRHAARLAFVRGRIADALGHEEEATRWLNEARTRFAIYPPHDLRRRRVEEYLARRS
jgi:tetratricopeptide (TPR) repeat protein